MSPESGHLCRNPVSPDSGDRIPAIWPEQPDSGRLAGQIRPEQPAGRIWPENSSQNGRIPAD
jgi:hypothetical protein